jgi:hypothetical protein
LFIAEPIWRKTEQGKKEKRYKQFSIKIWIPLRKWRSILSSIKTEKLITVVSMSLKNIAVY